MGAHLIRASARNVLRYVPSQCQNLGTATVAPPSRIQVNDVRIGIPGQTIPVEIHSRSATDRDARFPLLSPRILPLPYESHDTPNMQVASGTSAIQRQIGSRLAGIGELSWNHTTHLWTVQSINPGCSYFPVPVACSPA